MIKDYLYVLICSVLPVVELRGAIPIAAALNIPWWAAYLVAVVGNMLPIPFIMLFIRRILKWMKKVKHLDKIALWLEEKAAKNSNKVMKYESIGLCIFVAIPLPGTGGWTGALVAAMLNMRLKYALPSIFAGILIAGFILTGVSYGFLHLLSFMI
ncbi:MAG: small multi-drug export protein [Ruminococcaceae bacterium]|nr:small multi-drug export protein [Oscillospiraceae bacterium]